MLGILPTEVILAVLSFLPLRQLQRLQQLSKLWRNFINVNESEIHHAAARLHNFIKPNANLQGAQKSHVWLRHVRSWKDLCHSYSHLERRWEGYEQPNAAIFGASGKAVWRFKVDEEQSTVITTHFDGGLRVTAINGGVLWLLPHSELHPYAHCEYTDGYLVLTRRGQGVDVWRRQRDIRDIELPSTLQSDWRQQRARASALQSPVSAEQDNRGAFVPWTTIHPPRSIHALRAVDSTLLLASYDAQEAYLYDIPSGRHLQTIPFDKDPEAMPIDLSYVELGRRHIFVCGDRDVVVTPLDPSDAQTFLKFPSQIPGFDELYQQKAHRVLFDGDGPIYKPSTDPDGTLIECICEPESEDLTPLDPSGLRNFKAGAYHVLVPIRQLTPPI
ncbi:hypothetical protein BU17DRAFT_81525 [Hysterangium stoloniferum]|nr:hypothetical protein BU17DRAFT_81525 [Hysterangium stoloniferum]